MDNYQQRLAALALSPDETLCFLSHDRGGATGTEAARSMKDHLCQFLNLSPERIFLADSRDQRGVDLTQLRRTRALVLVQTEQSLFQPIVIAEVMIALQEGIPIVPVVIRGGGYNSAKAAAFMASWDFYKRLEEDAPECIGVLEKQGIDMRRAGNFLLKHIPDLVSLDLDLNANEQRLKLAIECIVDEILSAKRIRNVLPAAANPKVEQLRNFKLKQTIRLGVEEEVVLWGEAIAQRVEQESKLSYCCYTFPREALERFMWVADILCLGFTSFSVVLIAPLAFAASPFILLQLCLCGESVPRTCNGTSRITLRTSTNHELLQEFRSDRLDSIIWICDSEPVFKAQITNQDFLVTSERQSGERGLVVWDLGSGKRIKYIPQQYQGDCRCCWYINDRCGLNLEFASMFPTVELRDSELEIKEDPGGNSYRMRGYVLGAPTSEHEFTRDPPGLTYDWVSQSEIMSLLTGEAKTVVLSWDRKFMAVREESAGTIEVWNIPEKKQMQCFPIKNVSLFVLSVNAQVLGTITEKRLTVWDVENGLAIKMFDMESEPTKVMFHPDLTCFLTYHDDDDDGNKTVCVWGL